MARLPMPPIPDGPLRNLIGTLHELHAIAGWPSTITMTNWVKDDDPEAKVGKSSIHKLFVSGELPNGDQLLRVAKVLADKACARPGRPQESTDDWCDKIDALYQEAVRDAIYNPTVLAEAIAPTVTVVPKTPALIDKAAVTTMGAAMPDPGSSSAVLIGVSKYQDGLPDLPGTAEAVGKLHKLLLADKVFAPANITLIPAATRTAMLEAVTQAAQTASDTLLLYFAGHGLVSGRGELLLAGSDTDPNHEFTATAFRDIRDLLVASKARRTVVILDSCYSGHAGNLMGTLDGLSYIPASMVLTSSSPYSASLHGPDGPLFTRLFTDILAHGIPDGPPLLDLTSIHDEMIRRAESASTDVMMPVPQLTGQPGTQPVALAHNRMWARMPEPVSTRTASGAARSGASWGTQLESLARQGNSESDTTEATPMATVPGISTGGDTAPPSADQSPAATPTTQPQFLTTALRPVAAGPDLQVGPADLGGEHYEASIVHRDASFCRDPRSAIEYNLDQRFRTFDVTVGILDDTNDTSQTGNFQVVLDGVLQQQITVHYGAPRNIQQDVTGARRLRLVAYRPDTHPTPLHAGAMVTTPLALPALAWGNPTLLPNLRTVAADDFRDVPSPNPADDVQLEALIEAFFAALDHGVRALDAVKIATTRVMPEVGAATELPQALLTAAAVEWLTDLIAAEAGHHHRRWSPRAVTAYLTERFGPEVIDAGLAERISRRLDPPASTATDRH
ncbi:caspase, EACC1-associated type [Nocardia niigatensis]